MPSILVWKNCDRKSIDEKIIVRKSLFSSLIILAITGRFPDSHLHRRGREIWIFNSHHFFLVLFLFCFYFLISPHPMKMKRKKDATADDLVIHTSCFSGWEPLARHWTFSSGIKWCCDFNSWLKTYLIQNSLSLKWRTFLDTWKGDHWELPKLHAGLRLLMLVGSVESRPHTGITGWPFPKGWQGHDLGRVGWPRGWQSRLVIKSSWVLILIPTIFQFLKYVRCQHK